MGKRGEIVGKGDMNRPYQKFPTTETVLLFSISKEERKARTVPLQKKIVDASTASVTQNLSDTTTKGATSIVDNRNNIFIINFPSTDICNSLALISTVIM